VQWHTSWSILDHYSQEKKNKNLWV
jgi:hypothetical protein